MLIIAGTIPIKDFPLVYGKATFCGSFLKIINHEIPCSQGTASMISAACEVSAYLKTDPPYILTAGDIGHGDGTRKIYNYLIENVNKILPDVIALHYCLPIMGLMKKFVEEVNRCKNDIKLLADASSMYAAKAAGVAKDFEIFTPDLSELCFLADKDATHPAYMKKHLFANSQNIDNLIVEAYKYSNAAKLLLIKGGIDYIVVNGKVIEKITEPDIPTLEAIGGTGDTITGLVSAFFDAGLEPYEAAIISAKLNRIAGKYAEVQVASKISDIINVFKDVFKDHLCELSGVCIREETQ